MKNNNSQNYNKGLLFKDEEINLNFLINLIFRNKNLILLFSTISFIFSGFTSFFDKDVWQGNTEIVIKDSSSRNNSLSNGLKGINIPGVRFNKTSMDLTTSVGILKSSSVLMPIFKFVKSEKIKLYGNYDETFFDWRDDYLKFILKKDTSILDIAYLDNDKDLIIPVLNKINDAYQKYSTKSKERSLELTTNYLKNQINIFRTKSSLSIKKAQEFAIDQDLSLVNFNPNSGSINIPTLRNITSIENNQKEYSSNNIDIEKQRVMAANSIKKIKLTIENIENVDDYGQLQYFVSNLPRSFRESELNKQLNLIDKSLISFKTRYKDNFDGIKRLEEEKLILLDFIKNKAIYFLKSELANQMSIMQSATRPKDIIIRYKELIRNAERDEDTLINLENQLITTKLQASKMEDPWELISTPYLFSDPVAPNRSLNIFLFTILGFIFGMIVSILKEFKSGLIFENDEIEYIFESSILEKINISEGKFLINSKNNCLYEILNINSSEIIQLFKPDSISKEVFEKLSKLLEKSGTTYKLIKTLDSANLNKKLLLILDISRSKKVEMIKLKNRLDFLEIELFGIILIIE